MKPSVLCITRAALVAQGIPESNAIGLYPFDLINVPANSYHFINRGVVDAPNGFNFEVGKVFPQILGYILVKHGDKYLSYARKHSGEARLLGSRSIGFGGHVDLEDYAYTSIQCEQGASFDEVLRFSVERELYEELELCIDEDKVVFSGLIVDQRDDVGSVHCGLLTEIEVNPKHVVSTKETQDLQWLTLEELKQDIEMYEGWSKIAIEHLLTQASE